MSKQLVEDLHKKLSRVYVLVELVAVHNDEKEDPYTNKIGLEMASEILVQVLAEDMAQLEELYKEPEAETA